MALDFEYDTPKALKNPKNQGAHLCPVQCTACSSERMSITMNKSQLQEMDK